MPGPFYQMAGQSKKMAVEFVYTFFFALLCVCDIYIKVFFVYLIKHHTQKMCVGVEVRKMSADVELFNRFCKVECTKKYLFLILNIKIGM